MTTSIKPGYIWGSGLECELALEVEVCGGFRV